MGIYKAHAEKDNSQHPSPAGPVPCAVRESSFGVVQQTHESAASLRASILDLRLNIQPQVKDSEYNKLPSSPTSSSIPSLLPSLSRSLTGWTHAHHFRVASLVL